MGTMTSHMTSLFIVYSTIYSGADQWKHQSSASLAIVREIHRWPLNSPHNWPVMRKMFPCDDVIMRLTTGHYCPLPTWQIPRFSLTLPRPPCRHVFRATTKSITTWLTHFPGTKFRMRQIQQRDHERKYLEYLNMPSDTFVRDINTFGAGAQWIVRYIFGAKHLQPTMSMLSYCRLDLKA